MKLESKQVIVWYSCSLGLSASAAVFAHVNLVVASLVGFGLIVVSLLSVLRVTHVEENANPYLKLSEQIAMIGIVSFLPMIFVMGLLEALLLFIGFAQLALNFQTHDYRRLYIGTCISFVVICAGAAQAKTGTYLLFILAYAVAVSITLGYAFITQHSHDQDIQWSATDRLRATFWLVGTALIIYLIVPRFPAGNLGGKPGSDHFYHAQDWEDQAKKDEKNQGNVNDQLQRMQEEIAHQDESKISDNTDDHSPKITDKRIDFQYRGFDQSFDINNPDEQGDRFSNTLVARMRSDHPLYLRIRIFDQFDGVQWHSSANTLLKKVVNRNGVDLYSDKLTANAQIHTYEMFIEQTIGDAIPAAAVPSHLQFPSTAIGIDAFGQLKSPKVLKKGTTYAVKSVKTFKNNRSFAENKFVSLPGYHQIPEGFDPRIKQLAKHVIQHSKTQLQAAIALEQHLRQHYAYDLESVLTSQNHTPLSEFLFDTKRGHCEYFASALAMMLRTVDIPSRLVTGFSATNQNPLTGYYDIYALDGHAWVEAYVDKLGWVELEPTAYYDGPVAKHEPLSAQQINEYIKRQQRQREALGKNNDISIENIAIALWQSLAFLTTVLLAYIKLLFIHFWPWILGLIILTLIGWMITLQIRPQWRAYRIRQRLLAATSTDTSTMLNNYLEAIDALLSNAGLSRPPGLSIERYLSRLNHNHLNIDQQLLANVFNQTQYFDNKVDPTCYQQLFDALYQLGYQKLRTLLLAKTP